MSQVFLQKLRDHFSTLEADPRTDVDSPLCTTIEGVSTRSREMFWIQVHAGMVNFKHLDSPEKEMVLDRILDDVDPPDTVDIEEGTYATFAISEIEPAKVDALFATLWSDYFDGGEGEAIIFAEEL